MFRKLELHSGCNTHARSRVFAECTMWCLTLKDVFVERMTNLLKLMINGDGQIQTSYESNESLLFCSATFSHKPS